MEDYEDPKRTTEASTSGSWGKKSNSSPRQPERKVIKTSAEINEIENRTAVKKINEIKSRWFGKINEMDEHRTRLPKKKGRKRTGRQHARRRGHRRRPHGPRKHDKGGPAREHRYAAVLIMDEVD